MTDKSKMTTDELLEILAWVRDRAAYRRICKIPTGPEWAEDCRAEEEALTELVKRGYPYF